MARPHDWMHDPFERAPHALGELFRSGVLRTDGAVDGCWFTAEVAEPDGDGRAPRDSRDPRRTWVARHAPGTVCVGIALRRVGRETTSRTFRFTPDMDDEAVATRATERRRWDAPQAEWGDPDFPAWVADLQACRGGATAPNNLVAAMERHLSLTSASSRGTPKDDAGVALAAVADGVGPFLDTLDPAALSFVGTAVAPHAVKGRWSGIDATFGTGAPLRTALERHPHLASVVLAAWDYHGDEMTEAVAHGRETELLAAVLARTKAVRRSTAGTLATAEQAYAGLLHADTPWADADEGLGTSFATLSDLGADMRPVDVDEWAAAIPAAGAVKVAVHVAGRDGASAFLDVGRSWSSWRRRVDEASGIVPVSAAAQDLDDVVRAFASQVLTPALALGGRGGRLANEVRCGRSILWSGSRLRRCLDVSRRWHERRHATEALLARLRAEAGQGPALEFPPWEAGLPDARTGGLTIEVLRGEAALADEGRRGACADGTQGLAHCVGSYGPTCRSGERRILSVRRDDGPSCSRVSTFEVDVSDDDYRLLQHRGHGNGIPPREAEAAVAAYLGRVRTGRVAVDRRAFRPVPGPPDAVGATAAGYDWTVTGAWDRVHEAWRPYLPRTLRTMGLTDWTALGDRVARDHGDGCWRPIPWRPEPCDPEPEGPRP